MKNYILQDNNNNEFNFSDYQENNFLGLIIFRGAWCNLCKKQLKEIQELLSDFTNLNVKLLAISPDSKLKSSLLKTFLKVQFPILSDEKMEVINDFNILENFKGQQLPKPAIFLYNPDGQLILEKIGDNYEDSLSGKNILKEFSKVIKLAKIS